MDVVVDHRVNTIEKVTLPPCGGPGGKLLRVGHVDDKFGVSVEFHPSCKFQNFIVFEVDGQVKAVFPNISQCQQVIDQNVHIFNSMGKPCNLHIMQLDKTGPHKILQTARTC